MRSWCVETSETVCSDDLVELYCSRVVGPLDSNVDVADEQNRIGERGKSTQNVRELHEESRRDGVGPRSIDDRCDEC